MATFAIVENGVVINTISAESLEIAQELFSAATCVEYFLVAPGWTYADGRFVEPSLETPAAEEVPAEEVPAE